MGKSMNMWGIDSATPITNEFLAQVTAYYTDMPAVLGRYLGDYGMTPEELAVIRSGRQFLVPIWNMIDQAEAGSGTESQGAAQAAAACDRADALGLRIHTLIAYDLENWPLSRDYLLGLAQTTAARHRIPLWYTNPLVPAIAETIASLPLPLIGYVWANEPEPFTVVASHYATIPTPLYHPALQSAIKGYQYTENVGPNHLVDLDVWDTALAPYLDGGVVTVRLTHAVGVKREPAHGGPNLDYLPANLHVRAAARVELDQVWTYLPDYRGWILASQTEAL